MEIKTAQEIEEDIEKGSDDYVWTKWVRVDDVMNALANFEFDIHSHQVISPKIISIILKEYFRELLSQSSKDKG